MYNVWRRWDGYVGATISNPWHYAKEFEILLSTEDLAEAEELVKKERSKPEYLDTYWSGKIK